MARPFAGNKRSTGLFVSGLSLDEPRQFRSGSGLGVGDEAGRVVLHQALQRGLLGPASRVTERAAGGFTESRSYNLARLVNVSVTAVLRREVGVPTQGSNSAGDPKEVTRAPTSAPPQEPPQGAMTSSVGK